MAQLDVKMAAVALDLITRFGKTVTYTQEDNSSYDPAVGEVTASSIVNFTVKVSPPDPYDVKLIDGDIIRVGDTSSFLASSGLAFTPREVGDKIDFDGEKWRVVGVTKLWSGDNVAAYQVQLRRN